VKVGEGAALHTPEFYLDPYPEFRRLRHEDPVHWHGYEGGGFWAVTRHEDVCQIGRSPELFLSGKGVNIPVPDMIATMKLLIGSVIVSDPPLHTDLRRIAQPFFSQGRRNELEPILRQYVRSRLDHVRPDVPFDLVQTVTAPLPTFAVGELLGVPAEQRKEFQDATDAVAAYDDPDVEFDEQGSAALAPAMTLFLDMVNRRRAEPEHDLISALATALVGGEPMADFDVLKNCFIYLVGGTETARNMMSFGMAELARRPADYQQLRAHPEQLPATIEEMLRWSTPVIYFSRVASRDTELRGKSIAAGDCVALFYASANRDESVFGDTVDQFCITRDPNPHVAFGFGEHFCIGAQLARLEARIFFEEFFQRFSAIELAEPPERMLSMTLNSAKKVLIRAHR
jgi:cytochrome P450